MQSAYDSFVAFAKNPVFKIGEMLVIAAGLIHGLNGIRIALNSFGIGVRYQKITFLLLMGLALVGIVMFRLHYVLRSLGGSCDRKHIPTKTQRRCLALVGQDPGGIAGDRRSGDSLCDQPRGGAGRTADL